MDTISIKVSRRQETGKKATNRMRKEGNVPCVLYGGSENINFSAPELAFKNLIYNHRVFLVNLDIDGEKHQAVVKEISFHPVTDRILHLDFMEVVEGKPVTISVPVHVIGDSVGIKAGGKLRLKRRSLKIRALPDDLPDFIEVDITLLNVGQSIKVKDVSLENIEILDPAPSMIVGVVSSRVARTAEEIEAEEGAEGAETEGGEGEGESAEGAEPAAEKKEE